MERRIPVSSFQHACMKVNRDGRTQSDGYAGKFLRVDLTFEPLSNVVFDARACRSIRT